MPKRSRWSPTVDEATISLKGPAQGHGECNRDLSTVKPTLATSSNLRIGGMTMENSVNGVLSFWPVLLASHFFLATAGALLLCVGRTPTAPSA